MTQARVRPRGAAPRVAEVSTLDGGTIDTVVAGLVPAIRDFCDINDLKSWMVRGARVRARRCSIGSKFGTKGTESRHFLASDCGTIWTSAKSARSFAPLTVDDRHKADHDNGGQVAAGESVYPLCGKQRFRTARKALHSRLATFSPAADGAVEAQAPIAGVRPRRRRRCVRPVFHAGCAASPSSIARTLVASAEKLNGFGSNGAEPSSVP